MHVISEFHLIRTIISGFTQLAKSSAVLKKPNSDHNSGSGSKFDNQKKTSRAARLLKLHTKNQVNLSIAASFTLHAEKKQVEGPVEA